MILNLRPAKTRFMNGNIDIDGDIFNILIDAHGQRETLLSDFDTDEAIYSDGFISAIKDDKVPELKLHESFLPKKDKEYHHVIISDVCYFVYFN